MRGPSASTHRERPNGDASEFPNGNSLQHGQSPTDDDHFPGRRISCSTLAFVELKFPGLPCEQRPVSDRLAPRFLTAVYTSYWIPQQSSVVLESSVRYYRYVSCD